MKTRKKTKLCLQCNGVNPLTAGHCAYCGAVLANEMPEDDYFQQESRPAPVAFPAKGSDLGSQSGSSSNQVLPHSASSPKEPFYKSNYQDFAAANASHSAMSSQLYNSSKEVEEQAVRGAEKPLYSVFDQPSSETVLAPFQPELKDSQESANPVQEEHKVSRLSLFHSLLNRLKACKSILKPWQSLESGHYQTIVANTTINSALMLGCLGILTLLFNDHGLVVLSWSAKIWPWLLGAATVLFGIGYRLTQSFK